MLKKLLDFGIDGKFFNVIRNIYTNDKVCTEHEDKITDTIDVNLGVKVVPILAQKKRFFSEKSKKSTI